MSTHAFLSDFYSILTVTSGAYVFCFVLQGALTLFTLYPEGLSIAEVHALLFR